MTLLETLHMLQVACVILLVATALFMLGVRIVSRVRRELLLRYGTPEQLAAAHAKAQDDLERLRAFADELRAGSQKPQ